MKLIFTASLCLLVTVSVLDYMGLESPVLFFLFGIGWISLLTVVVLWVIKQRICRICHRPWSLADDVEFSTSRLIDIFHVCPHCRNTGGGKKTA